MSLRAPLLARAGAAREALEALPDLEARLEAIVASARAAWPGLALPAEDFLGHLGEKLSAQVDPAGALGALHAGDLYLACACATGDPAALEALEREHLAQVPGYLARTGAAGLSDEVTQVLRARLLVAEDGRPPRIAGFTGQGPLGAWLRMASARAAHDLRRGERRRGAREREPLVLAAAAAADPELEYLKLRCRPELEAAFDATLASLSAQDATVLRLHFLDGLTIDAIAAVYQVASRTVHRWLARMRQQILEETRRRLAERLALSVSQIDTVMRLVQSQVEVDIRELLGRRRDG